ncbi:hypothetical protein FRC11_008007, partial [Ceratobasidium sp. 423]
RDTTCSIKWHLACSSHCHYCWGQHCRRLQCCPSGSPNRVDRSHGRLGCIYCRL